MIKERLKNNVNNIKKYIPKKDSIKPYIEKIKTYMPKEPLKKLTSNSSICKNKTENFFKENSVWITIVLIILVFYFFFDFDFLKQKSNKSEENTLTWFKDIILIATTAFGLPFLVWNYKNTYEQKETAKKSLQETENNNRRTQENKIFVDCINHLASDKETIRTASIHGFGELLENLENEIKNLSETDIRKQERINFQDKILNVLWSFMVEHSREILKFGNSFNLKYSIIGNFSMSDEYLEAKEHINALYHPQFRFIMELLTKYRPDIDALYRLNKDSLNRPLIDSIFKFWNNKYWREIYLQMIDLSRADLRNANLRKADLSKAFLIFSNLSRADLSDADLSRADLRNADLNGTILDDVNLTEAKYNNATIFPDGFAPTHHNMKNLDEPTEEAK